MKVLYITNSINKGGATVAILNLLTELQKISVEPMVLYPETGDFSKQLSRLGIKHGVLHNPLEVYPYTGNWGSRIKFPCKLFQLMVRRCTSYVRLCRYIEDFKPDIIHTNVGPIHIGYKAAKRYNLPHVWHIREYQIEDFNLHPFPTLRHYLEMIHDTNSHCICITKGLFNHFKLDPIKDRVIYDGVIDRNQRKDILSEKQNYILFAGRLEDAKGLKDLIVAYRSYLEQGGKHFLYVAGNGSQSYIDACRNLLKEEQQDMIRFLGLRNDIFELMSHAALLVVPSRNEGFGFITAEAMFNGTLVIGRNTGGTKEQFDNGLQLMGREIGVRYESLSELICKLKEYDDVSDRNIQMIRDAQNTVCCLYDKALQARKVFDFYLEILHRN